MKQLNAEKRSFSYHFIKNLDMCSLLVMTVALVVFFLVQTPSFLSLGNLNNLIQINAALVIVAVGVTFVIISGNIDLSSGAILVFTNCFSAWIFQQSGNIWLALVCCVAIACLIGVINGFMIAKMGLNPVIVTLACMIWGKGLALAVSGASSIPIDSPVLTNMYRPFALDFFNVSLILIIAVFVLGWYLLNYTKFGRYTFAIGENEQAANQAGINTSRVKWLIFIFAATLTGVASVVETARFSGGIPTAGDNMEMNAIVAVVIGGTKMTGGEGSFARTFAGLLFMSILSNGLTTLGMNDNIIYVIKGAIILVVLLVQVSANNYRSRYLKMLNAY